MYYTKTKDSTLKEENIHSGRHESEEFTRKDHIWRGFFLKFCFNTLMKTRVTFSISKTYRTDGGMTKHKTAEWYNKTYNTCFCNKEKCCSVLKHV